jgi:uncharacterized delta-60 repeat protein
MLNRLSVRLTLIVVDNGGTGERAMARSDNRSGGRSKRRSLHRWGAESLEQRCMFAAGDLDTTFNGTGFNITTPISPDDQFATTMGIMPIAPNYIVMGGYREVAKSSSRIADPADLELVFLDANGQLATSIGSLGSITAQVGLGDSRIAGLDFQVIGGTVNIITVGYTVVSGNDLTFTFDESNQNSPIRVTSASRKFSTEDIGATLNILDDGDVNSRWIVNDYQIVDVDAASGTAFLNVAPAEQGIETGAINGWWSLDGSTDMLVSRFTFSGTQVTLDTTFGINGHAIIPVAKGVNNYDYAYAVDVDSLNRIVVAGYSQNALGQYDMSVVRLLPTGALDTTFYWANQPGGTLANRGRVMVNVRNNDYANAVSVAPSGQIFIAGSSNGTGSPAPTFVKLDEFGVPMTSFGPDSNGISVLTSTQAGRGFVNSTEIYPADAGALAGFLIATGTNTGSNRDTFVARINGATGALDTTFNTTGVVRENLATNGNDWGNSVTLQPAGAGLYGVVIAGSVEVTGQDYNMYVARYLSNGTRDNTFFGSSYIHVLSELQGTTAANPDYGATVKLDASNKIVVTGSSYSGDTPDFDMTAVRLVGTPAVASANLNALSRSITENDAGAANVSVDLVLSKATSTPVTVSYTTANGTGTAGVDYIAKSGTVTFAAGATRRTVTLQILGNTNYQPNRSFELKLLGANGAVLENAIATITIRDNDGTWQNVVMPEDVDADNDVEPQDVLRLADDYRANGPRQLTQAITTPSLWSDVNGDTVISPADILAVLDAVNRKSFFGGKLLAANELSTPAAASVTQSNFSSHDAEIATGLSMPVNISGTASLQLPAASSEVLVAPSIHQTTSVAPPTTVDAALSELTDDATARDGDADEALYALIANG